MTPVLDIDATGDRIRLLMMKKNVSVTDIQAACGLAVPSGVYKWLHGVGMPTIDNLIILAHLLDVTVDDILVTREVEL